MSRIIEYFSVKYGKVIVVVLCNICFQNCFNCEEVMKKFIFVRIYVCIYQNYVEDRDLNVFINIL